MQQGIPSPIRHRWALAVLALLSLASAAPLLLEPGSTASAYAFNLSSPATATLLGCCQLAGAVALAMAWREGAWGGAAVLGPGVFAATTMQVAVTLGEHSRLQLAGAGPLAATVTAGWLFAGWAAPLGWLFLVFVNDRRWTADPPGRPEVPRRLLFLVGLQAAALLVAGGWLFVAPGAAILPWRLGDPGGRLAGGWLVAAGLTGLALLVERDEGRTRAAFAGALVLGLTLLPAGALEITPLRPGLRLVAYAVFLLSLVLAGGIGLRLGFRDRRARLAPFVR